MDRLRAGAALFNAGHYLAAHEPWEERWLEDPRGERDDCLQGLVQATAAVHKARLDNRSGAIGLAESGAAYLEGCGYDDLRAFLERLASEPERVDEDGPPVLAIDGDVVTVEDLRFPAVGIAAEAIAETRGEAAVEVATEYAIADVDAGDETSPFVELTLAYLRDPDAPAIRDRLVDHVDRRRTREADVEGLFDAE